MIVKSYAKLNLYLAVLNRRKDNFHDIKTVFEKIDLCDKIALIPRRDNLIRIACSEPAVPRDHSNLAYRSAKLLQDTFGIKRGLDIKIIKRIPVGAGLGGGSSNAAAVLTGLNRLWKLNLGIDELAKLASKLGSDVPFFIYNSRFAEGTGRGELIKPLKIPDNTTLWHILVVPKINVSTPLIYKKYDLYAKKLRKVGLTPPFLGNNKKNNLERAGLTRPVYNANIFTSILRNKSYPFIGEALYNGLEPVTTRLYPEVTRIKERFVRLGLKAILMSGSGPAVFAVVSSRKEAVSLSRQLERVNKLWRVFVSKTV